jgi:DNA-binding NarL/FixJ family response regulator
MWLAISVSTNVAREARLQIALVCAPEILRLGLERILAHDATLSVRAHRRLQAVQGAPDVAILCDRELSDAARACAAAVERLDTGVVLVTAGADPHIVLDCLAAGATGFLTEADSASHLKPAAHAAAAGKYHLGPHLLTLLLDWQRAQRRRAESTREAELQLLALLAGGRTTPEIATELGVAAKTVRNRLSLLYRRLGVRSRAEAVRVAEVRGLLN